ncbi:MAG: hypothetical protein ACKVOP_07040 [Sphingomonadaceae bacterium]
MSSIPPDPMAMFRDAVTQWEKIANDWGSQFMARPETTEAMHNATTFALKAQQGAQEAMTKLLAAANMPSKAEVEAISGRLTDIEKTLARIEAAIAAPVAAAAPQQKPKRTRTPTPPK